MTDTQIEKMKKEVKADFKEGMTLEQAKAYKTVKMADAISGILKTIKWAIFAGIVVSAGILTLWFIDEVLMN